MVTLNFWFDLEEYLVSSPNGKPKREAYTPVCASDTARPDGEHMSHTDGLRMCGVMRVCVRACVARQVFRHLLPLLVQASRFPEDFDNLPKGSPAPPRRMISRLCHTLPLDRPARRVPRIPKRSQGHNALCAARAGSWHVASL